MKGTKVVVRWVMEGHDVGYGILSTLGDPTGKRVQVNQLSLLVQVKLAQLADAGKDERADLA